MTPSRSPEDFTTPSASSSNPEVADAIDQANLVGYGGRFGRRDYYQAPVVSVAR
jgi:hypothetical protein